MLYERSLYVKYDDRIYELDYCLNFLTDVSLWIFFREAHLFVKLGDCSADLSLSAQHQRGQSHFRSIENTQSQHWVDSTRHLWLLQQRRPIFQRVIHRTRSPITSEFQLFLYFCSSYSWCSIKNTPQNQM